MALRYLAGKTVMLAGEAMSVMRPAQERKMSRVGKSLLSVVSWQAMPQQFKSRYSHYRPNIISSPILDQLDRFCEKIGPLKPAPIHKVTVLGATSDVGITTCLFLKQNNLVRYLAMYEDKPGEDGESVIGYACDLAHIDTSTAVQAYQGRSNLQEALHDADVVLLCGGQLTCQQCGRSCVVVDRENFYANMKWVKANATSVAHFAPDAILCVQTPPVDANYSLVRHVLKTYKVYDRRRLLGVNAVTAMRANQLYCALADLDPVKSYCPCVGGTGRITRIPVLSSMKNHICMAKAHMKQIDMIYRLVKEADDLICQAKCQAKQAHLSVGFATARFIITTLRGLLGQGSGFLDSALVEQMSPEECYGLKICATPVTIGNGGIVAYHIPKLNAREMEMLEACKADLQDMLHLGKCYALGENYYCPCVCPLPIGPPPSEVCCHLNA